MENKSNERWHGAHHYSNKIHLAFIIVLFFIAASLFWAYFKIHDERFLYKNISIPAPLTTPAVTPFQDNKILCTQDAMLCPDGSYVGRTGPNCEFVCP